MTVTNKGSGSRTGANMASMPEVVDIGPEQKVLVTMVRNAKGLNAGEVGRFPKSVAAQLVSKGEASRHQAAPAASNAATAVAKAMSAIHRSNDAKKLIAKNLREVQDLVNDADRLTQRACDIAEKELAGQTGGVEILIEQDREASAAGEEQISILEGKTKEANGNVAKAKKSLKSSEDKEAGQALVSEAEKAVADSEEATVSFVASNEEAKASRLAAIDGFSEDVSLVEAVNKSMAELDVLRAATEELDEQLNG